MATSQNQPGLSYIYTAGDQAGSPDLLTADYFLLHVVFSHGDASFGGDINANNWNLLLGVSGNGTTAPASKFLTNAPPPFDLILDVGIPLSYLTDQPLQTVTLDNGDTVYMADTNYGVSSVASGSKTNIAAYFLITGSDASTLKTFLSTNPAVILSPYNNHTGGGGFYRLSNIISPGDRLYQNNNGATTNIVDRWASFRLQGFQNATPNTNVPVVARIKSPWEGALELTATNLLAGGTNAVTSATDLGGTWQTSTVFVATASTHTVQSPATNPAAYYRIEHGP